MVSRDADETGPFTSPMAASGEVRVPDEDVAEDLLKVLREVLAPLVAADGGAMYVVKAAGDDIHLHLTGTCAGCPGASLTRDGVIAPALRTVRPKARVVVTTSFRVPDGARKV